MKLALEGSEGGVGVDLDSLKAQVSAIEAAADHDSAKHAAVVQELDRLAEHLVGESDHEVLGIKHHIQDLIAQVAPERHDVLRYVEQYCNGSRP